VGNDEVTGESELEGGFADLVDPTKWKDYDTFMIGMDEAIESDIRRSLEYRRELRRILLADPQLRARIKQVTPQKLDWARSKLFSSKVCAVDGTLSRYCMASGTRYRVGVVATTYVGNRIERVLYVSESTLAEPSSGPVQHFNTLLTSHRQSGLLLRAIMLYAERDLALRREEPWKFVHGELLPYELRTGVGKYRALAMSVDLGSRLIESKKTIGVIEGTTRLDWLNAGDILQPYEYMTVTSLQSELNRYLHGDPEKGITGAHFSKSDEKRMQDFIDEYARAINVGIFRVGARPYIFQAHADHFHEAAALVMQDASQQAVRGFPLLIDYADSICSRLLAQEDFTRQITFKTAKLSPKDAPFELYERSTRRR